MEYFCYAQTGYLGDNERDRVIESDMTLDSRCHQLTGVIETEEMAGCVTLQDSEGSTCPMSFRK